MESKIALSQNLLASTTSQFSHIIHCVQTGLYIKQEGRKENLENGLRSSCITFFSQVPHFAWQKNFLMSYLTGFPCVYIFIKQGLLPVLSPQILPKVLLLLTCYSVTVSSLIVEECRQALASTFCAYFKFITLLCLPKSTMAAAETDIRQKPNNRIWYQQMSCFEKAI